MKNLQLPTAAAILLTTLYTPVCSTTEEATLTIGRTSGEISIDGQLTDAGWTDADTIETWYETRPGDNIEPKVKNVGYLAYDDKFFYAAFEFFDPEPKKIRSPLANRDRVPSYTDYGGVMIDANNDGKTAQMFLANARGIQYDAINSDAAGEDSSPDFFWDSAARITEEGWILEMRIPFSSLRYTESDPEQWGIMLYRNRPREFRYQMFSSRLPRESSCFICNVKPLKGLEDLPSGGHWIAAPYVNGNQLSQPAGDLGSPLESGDVGTEVGLDAKWLPNPNTVLDLTLNPDFSQIESDVAQIGANERFALFFPEKRPFFLEGSDLFSTPLQAVYTRTFTSPRWGTRATGEIAGNNYTLLIGEDRGGGSTIIPESNSSDLADQDFESKVVMGRFKRDIGKSFISMIYSGREIDGGAYNRVVGPDFRWQVTENDVVTGQLLFSRSETPDRTDLADEWDGRKLSGHAAELWWHRQTKTWDFFALYNDLGDDFRADNGFIPQVGYQRGFAEVGHSIYPKDKPVSRMRLFTFTEYSADRDGNLLFRQITPGFGLDSLLNSFVRFEFRFNEVRSGSQTFKRQQVRTRLRVRPGKVVSQLSLDGIFGDEVDFANDRLGSGATIQFDANLRPSDHLEFEFNGTRRWIDVESEAGLAGRLFTAEVARLRGTYTFTSRMWLRLIAQQVEIERRLELYIDEVDPRSEFFSGSAVFAYKLNWQTVLFLGYGDNRELDDFETLQKSDRQIFLKLSYAFQH